MFRQLLPGFAAASAAALLAFATPAAAQQDWCVSGHAAYEARDFAESREAFTACIEGGDVPETVMADALHRRGRSAMKLGEHDAALADFDRALAIDEAHAQALNSRGWTLLLKGLPEEALPDLEAAKALAPSDPRIADSYAHVLAALGRDQDALEAFQAAVELQTPQQIAKLQDRLREAGYDAGPSDGVSGPKTRDALAACVRDRCIIWD